MSCQHCKGQNCIEQVPIFHSLNPSEMMEIAAINYAKFYEKGEMVYPYPIDKN